MTTGMAIGARRVVIPPPAMPLSRAGHASASVVPYQMPQGCHPRHLWWSGAPLADYLALPLRASHGASGAVAW